MALRPQVFDDSTNSIILTDAVAWPVGSIFMSTLSSNPTAILGYGTWAAFGQGQVPVGFKAGDPDFGTGGQTGGEKTHTLTIPEMPSHTHTQAVSANPTVGTEGSMGSDGPSDDAFVGETQITGASGAHNNLQPYVVVFMWLRTS